MSAPMTMNRVVHAAVRRDFERLGFALGSFADGDRQRAQGLERAYANVRTQLTHHHESEDRWIWPMLADVGVNPDLLAAMESEHQAMSTALAETGNAMKAFAASGSGSDAAAARQSVTRTQAVIEHHLTHEEEELEPALLPHAESAQWKEVERKLSRQPPSVAGPFFAWLTDGMGDDVRTYLRSTVPRPVTWVLGRVFGRRYHREIAPVWRQASG